MSRSIILILLFGAAILLRVSTVQADFATPFVDTHNKVGDVSEAPGFVVNLGTDDEPRFMVLVLTDTMSFHQIGATADRGVVSPSMLGRQVIIKAEVIKPVDGWATPSLKILNVRMPQVVIQPATAPAKKPTP